MKNNRRGERNMEKQEMQFAVKTDKDRDVQSIGKSIITQPKICFDESKGHTKWFEKYGDKENFTDAKSWFSEMLQMQILVREEGQQ